MCVVLPAITLDVDCRCMDGTPGGYYYSPSTNTSVSNNWVIFLDGGGECASQKLCETRINTTLGSSNYFSKSKGDLGQLAAGDCKANPTLCQWNRVEVAYCSQDLHSGSRSQPSSRSWNYRFAGALIVEAIVQDLRAKANLAAAATIIVGGASAGGIGVWHHLDRIAQALPAARVVGTPIAGYYFPAYPYTGVNHTSSSLADFQPAAWPDHVDLWQSKMDESCVQAKAPADQWQCMLANYSYDYITTPVFITEAQTDEVVLTAHDWVPGAYVHEAPEQAYLTQWANNMTSGLARAMGSHNGVFNAACFIHTSFYNDKPLIRGVSYHQALLAWMAGKPAHYIDNCGVMCNPTCP